MRLGFHIDSLQLSHVKFINKSDLPTSKQKNGAKFEIKKNVSFEDMCREGAVSMTLLLKVNIVIVIFFVGL